MLKALLRKNYLSLISSFEMRRSVSGASKKGFPGKSKRKPGSKRGRAAFILLWGFIIFSLIMAFFGVCDLFGSTLLPVGMAWLYYALTGIMGFMLSMIGNAFTASSMLFKAKDNELLLAMPVPANTILISRLIMLYLLCLIFRMIPVIPSLVQHGKVMGSVGTATIVNVIVMTLFSALLITAISSLLGWLISALNNKIRHKSGVTVIVTVVFLVTYYYFSFNANHYLQLLMNNSSAIGQNIRQRIIAWPLYCYGMAAAGDIRSMVFYCLFCIAVFGLVYILVSKNTMKILTATAVSSGNKYGDAEKLQQQSVALQSPKKALLKKELKRFLSSPVYMINCGLGTLMMIVGSVFLLIKCNAVRTSIEGLRASSAGTLDFVLDSIPLLLMCALFVALSANDLAAPSISLEGKSLWILKSLPVETKDILYAKKSLEFRFSVPGAMVLIAVMSYVFRLEYIQILSLLIASLLFIQLHADGSLFINLLYPKLDWSSEVVPIKQSLSVMVAFFIGPLVSLIVFGVYFLVGYGRIPLNNYMTYVFVVMAILLRLVDRLLNTKCAELFEAI